MSTASGCEELPARCKCVVEAAPKVEIWMQHVANSPTSKTDHLYMKLTMTSKMNEEKNNMKHNIMHDSTIKSEIASRGLSFAFTQSYKPHPNISSTTSYSS